MRSPYVISLVITHLCLTACSSAQLSPPPTFIPYEMTPGDASKVKGVVDNIRTRQHGEAPPFHPDNFSWFFSAAVSYAATLTIKNETVCKLGLYLKGPSPRQFGIDSEQSQTIYIREGKYEFAIDTRLCPGPTTPPPLYREEIFTAGQAYNFSLSHKDMEKFGKHVFNNETGGTLTVEINNKSYKIGQKPLSVDLPLGTYTAMVKGQCGAMTTKIEVVKGRPYESIFSCKYQDKVIDVR